MRRAGVEPAQPKAGGLQPLGLAVAQPTRIGTVARAGVEPANDHQGLSPAALPVYPISTYNDREARSEVHGIFR